MLTTNFHSACATSIVRTYYSFKIVQSPDVSYNTVIMGLWTWAEVTSGMVISCLPVMPKFFQHFGAKTYLSFSSKFKSSSQLKPESPDMKSAQTSIPYDQSFLKSNCDSSHSARCIDHGDHRLSVWAAMLYQSQERNNEKVNLSQ